jgi:2-amino-4-hydroxy-6-hydroxymethyldihydropteridine diphosphokinase
MTEASGTAQVWVGLGSNVGDKKANLTEALRRVQSFAEVIAISSLYKTDPVGYLDQDWFLNAAAGVRTVLEPQAFLQALLEVEQSMGRVRNIRNGPRTIDLDLLLWEGRVLDEPGLTVPHPRLPERRFVLEPLREIAPELRHPGSGETMDALATALALVPGPAVERWTAENWPPAL